MEEGFVAVSRWVTTSPRRMKFVAVEEAPGASCSPMSKGSFRAACRPSGSAAVACNEAGHRCIIECPLHFAQFDIRTGKYVDGPLAADVPAYEVRVADGAIYLRPPSP